MKYYKFVFVNMTSVPRITYPNDELLNYIYRVMNQVASYADFYALMPSDNPCPIYPGCAVEFPNDGTISGTEISRICSKRFNLASAGTYQVSFDISISGRAQLALELDGNVLPETVVGRSEHCTQLSGTFLVTTTQPNQVLSVNNPPSECHSDCITPYAGGNLPVSAHLVIIKMS